MAASLGLTTTPTVGPPCADQATAASTATSATRIAATAMRFHGIDETIANQLLLRYGAPAQLTYGLESGRYTAFSVYCTVASGKYWGQSLGASCAGVDVTVGLLFFEPPGLKRRSNSELLTTLTLENAIAAPAIHGNGESRPTAATGISTVL
jgi:hypothetical protein